MEISAMGLVRALQPKTISALEPFAQELEAIHPALRLRISIRAKRLALRLDPKSGSIHLVVPKRASLQKALAFARQYQDWIDRHAENIKPVILFEHGTIIPVLGHERMLQITFNPELKRTVITLTEDMLVVHTNKDDPSPRIIRFLKNIAREEITRLARQKAATIDRIITDIQIRDTKSRWGSCSPDGTLCFSWRLVLAPYESFDYVIAHEVAHLIHMNHKPRFWALCEKLSTDFATGHGWMKKNAQTLMRYG